MFCAYCGVRLTSGASSCQACGRASRTAIATATPPDGSTLELRPETPSEASDSGIAESALESGQMIGPANFSGDSGSDPGLTRAFTDSDPGVTRLAPDGGETIGPGGYAGGSASDQGLTRGGAFPGGAAHGVPGASGLLAVGTAFGTRYHIIRLLGMGGMGAVYQAWDDALGVAVALKIIRPEITADAASARDLEKRFKRELLLARQVTHKNVVRIHDLGEINGIKYLTMPYIQGSDLATILSQERRLSVARAVAIARQVAGGLQAAHEAGVVHRDLKPANVMIDADDNAVIMDFGIARSVSGGSATVAGAVVGTLEYMAPEQAMAQAIDHRADIYALGLMLYDMLLGPRYQSRAESAVAELMARVQKPLAPARTIDPSIPEPLERVIDRCTQPDPAARYATTQDLVNDLELVDPSAKRTGPVIPLSAPPITRPVEIPAPPKGKAVPLKAVIAAVVLLAAGGAAWMFRDRFAGPTTPTAVAGKPLAYAILPFRNASGDQQMNWLGAALPEMLRTEVGQSAALRPIPGERIFQIFQDLRIKPDDPVAGETIDRLKEWVSAEVTVAGQFVKVGEQIRLDATIYDSRRSDPVVLKATAANENALLAAVSELSRSIRDNLSLPPGVKKEVEAAALRPSSQSVQALRHYTEGLQLTRQGQHAAAVRQLEAAVQADQKFALAHARLGLTFMNLGYEREARRASQEAVDLSTSLPESERYLIAGMHARIVKDTATAIDAYGKLLAILPNQEEALFDLAGVYDQTGALDKASELYSRILEQDPNHIGALLAIGSTEVRRNETEKGLQYLNKALTLAIQVKNEEAHATVLHTLAIGYRLLNRLDEALRHSQQALEIRRKLGQKLGIAETLLVTARIQQALGKFPAAEAAYEESLALREEIGDKRGIGNTLLDFGNFHAYRGQYAEALKLFRESLEVQREVGNQTYEALLLSNIGAMAFLKGDYDEALTNYQRSLTIRQKLGVLTDVADTLHNIAETHERRGRYDRALEGYVEVLELRRKAGDKRNGAVDRYAMGAVFERQGRLGAALGSRQEALDAFKELGERGFWLGEMTNGYANALIQVGRGDEAGTVLDEAANIAKELRNDVLLAQNLVYRGDRALFAGDVKTARNFFEQAQKLALKTEDPHLTLSARLRLAMVAVAEGRHQVALPILKQLQEEARKSGLPYLSAESRLWTGEALIAARDLPAARTALEQAEAEAKQLGLRVVLAKIHAALARVSRDLKDEAKAGQYAAEAARLLEEIKKEAQPADVMKRADLKAIAAR
jgi:eukaryotic-like serine/threonine-protein kinase